MADRSMENIKLSQHILKWLAPQENLYNPQYLNSNMSTN